MTKQMTFKSLAWALVAGLTISFGACKKETTTPAETPKTLNKTTLTNNKTWYNQGSTIVHPFKSNGTYATTGTWKWVNNSDTLSIIMYSGDTETFWKVYYNTDTEMSCEKAGAGAAVLYKTSAW
jgi:hypothetical protein